uniref:LysM domain-containing protein n=1 Tax=Heterorhabditis bacteriophora TaxID=37862 RepID=A0A1I7WCB9_HETBA
MNYYYAPSVSQPDEHTFLCGYNRVRRYGTTQTLPESQPKKYTLYLVKPSDTLQGIALKNDCSVKYFQFVSSIVRANRLWSPAALHLKQAIRIPIQGPNQNEYSNQLTAQLDGVNSNSRETLPESIGDILSRIDDTIKSTTSTVRKLERESTIHSIDQDCVAHRQRHPDIKRHNSLPKILYTESYQML